MENLLNKTIGEIVTEDYRAAEVFTKYNIDFCCGGNKPFKDIKNTSDINFDNLLSDLKTFTSTEIPGSDDYQSWPLDKLADHIVQKHHAYVQEKILVIKEYLGKISEVHRERHPELVRIFKLFNDSSEGLTAHMKKEEFILFPFIRKMVESQKTGIELQRPFFQSVENPVNMMEDEHDVEGARFHEIAKLSDNYNVPEDGCNTYRVTYSLLKEFEEDLHLHIHLENNILFPKAIEMEKEIFKSIDTVQ